VSIQDTAGLYVEQTTKTFSIAATKGFEMGPDAISWQTINLGDTNTLSGDDPIVLNNTANVNLTNINLTAYALHGRGISSQFIHADNFSVNFQDACDGLSVDLVNATQVNVTGLALSPGNHTNDNGVGQEQLFFCLEAIDNSGDLSVQTYDTAFTQDWDIRVD